MKLSGFKTVLNVNTRLVLIILYSLFNCRNFTGKKLSEDCDSSIKLSDFNGALVEDLSEDDDSIPSVTLYQDDLKVCNK